MRPCRNHDWYLGDCLRCGERYQLPKPEGNEMINHLMDEVDFYHGVVPTPPTITARNDKQPKPDAAYDYAVKSWPAFFSAMIAGIKKHDIRDKRERRYQVGDRLLLCEYDPFGGGYSGRWAVFEITYVTSNDTPCAMSSNALDRDACILSVERLNSDAGDDQ